LPAALGYFTVGMGNGLADRLATALNLQKQAKKPE
jgi:hypothetical protein